MNHDYKYEGMSEEDRNSLTSPFKGGKNPNPEQRDRFVSDLIKARNESAKNDQIIQDVLAQRDELLAACKLLLNTEYASGPLYHDDFGGDTHESTLGSLDARRCPICKIKAAIAKAEGRAR